MTLRLTDLQPQFVRYFIADGVVRHQHVHTICEAQGVRFLCPKCYVANGMKPEGVHSVVCWSSSRGTPDSAVPGPGRWSLDGTGYTDLTLNGDGGKSRSVHLTNGCGWDGYITNGEATDA